MREDDNVAKYVLSNLLIIGGSVLTTYLFIGSLGPNSETGTLYSLFLTPMAALAVPTLMTVLVNVLLKPPNMAWVVPATLVSIGLGIMMSQAAITTTPKPSPTQYQSSNTRIVDHKIDPYLPAGLKMHDQINSHQSGKLLIVALPVDDKSWEKHYHIGLWDVQKKTVSPMWNASEFYQQAVAKGLVDDTTDVNDPYLLRREKKYQLEYWIRVPVEGAASIRKRVILTIEATEKGVEVVDAQVTLL